MRPNARAVRLFAARALAALLLLAPAAHALDPAAGFTTSDPRNPWVLEAEELRLDSDPEWLALGHYTDRAVRSGFRSYADDARFFLSPEGDGDPRLELVATLQALLSDPAAVCRFPARAQWLAERLPGLADALPPADCPDYESWREMVSADRAVLVFAASYLNSPSSMYGHTFLRFDSSAQTRDSPMLSWALNFGATIPPDENGLLYAWRGLAGGYPGTFAAGPYFEKLREYSRLENRDLWEYRLNLSPDEVDRMLRHIWELKEIVFDYFFFDENCSMRLLELLDVARPGHDLASLFPHYAIPVDTVRAVRDAGFVEGVDYRPSALAQLQVLRRGLDKEERRLALRLARDLSIADDEAFRALPPAKQRQVAEVAYGYVRYEAVRGPRVDDAARSLALLRLLNGLPGDPLPEPPRPVRPDEGHDTMMAAVAAGVTESRAFGELEWRISYHDLLDDRAGHPDDASLNMGRLVVRMKEGGTLQLQQLDILEITSLAPRDEFLRPISWRVNVGLDRQWTDGDDALTAQVNGGAGWTRALGPAVNVSGLVTGRLEYNPDKSAELDLAPGLMLLLTADGRLGRSLLSAEAMHFMDGTERTRLVAAHDVSLLRNLALRAACERVHSNGERVNECRLALRHHF